MTGENFKRLNRNTQIKDLQKKIYELQDECGELMRISKETESNLDDKYWILTKEIEWNKYLLWGATKGILQ